MINQIKRCHGDVIEVIVSDKDGRKFMHQIEKGDKAKLVKHLGQNLADAIESQYWSE